MGGWWRRVAFRRQGVPVVAAIHNGRAKWLKFKRMPQPSLRLRDN